MHYRVQTPVAFLLFNRPDVTQRVFERIAAARPSKLILIADGPRSDRAGEDALCSAARGVVERIDWPCEVVRDYSEQNLGCKRRVASGLDHVFEAFDSAIVLEDDCLPDPSLFRFFDEMLERYRDDTRVMMVSGFNPVPGGWMREAQPYHFSFCGSIWGWASWRRAWKAYDIEMRLWDRADVRQRVKDVFAEPELYEGRLASYQRTHQGEVDSWDMQWSFARAINSGLSVVPASNLVSNIGFRSDATHTRKTNPAVESVAVAPMAFPLRFHDYVAPDREYDRQFTRIMSGKPAPPAKTHSSPV